MQGYRLGWMRLRRLERSAKRALRAVRLWRRREIDDHLREGQIALRWTEVVKRVTRRDGDLECFRIGETDVLRGHRERAAEHDHRIGAALDHSRHPVERALRIAAAETLVKRAQHVVRLFPALVVPCEAQLQRVARDV